MIFDRLSMLVVSGGAFLRGADWALQSMLIGWTLILSGWVTVFLSSIKHAGQLCESNSFVVNALGSHIVAELFPFASFASAMVASNVLY